jgi:hypothetical protein
MNIWNPPDWAAIEAIGTWAAAIGTLGAVFVALRLARRDIKSRRIERRGEIIAMCADVYHARKRMETLTEQKIQAPLYRIPDSTLATVFRRNGTARAQSRGNLQIQYAGKGPLTDSEWIASMIRNPIPNPYVAFLSLSAVRTLPSTVTVISEWRAV